MDRGETRRLMVSLLIVLAGSADVAVSQPPPATDNDTAITVDVGEVFRRTEEYLRPPRLEETAAIVGQLQAAGQTDAVQHVVALATPTSADLQRLTRQLLQLGYYDAAHRVLDAWSKTEPNQSRIVVFRAAAYRGQGMTELAMRELRSLDPTSLAEDRGLAELLSRLVEFPMQGVPLGDSHNPWQVKFSASDGTLPVGTIDEAQRERIPPDAVASMAQLVELLPKQPDLWVLMGYLLNATGDSKSALHCWTRAQRILQYHSADLRRHSRTLEAALRDQGGDLLADAGLGDGTARVTASPEQLDASSDDAGWQLLNGRPWVITVVGIGVSLFCGLAFLQIREWRRGNRESGRTRG